MKYGNKKTIIDGFEFDSKLEARRYCELKLLLRSGAITELTLQKIFVLQEAFIYDGKKERPITYVSDFYYKDKFGNEIVEDTKGFKTDIYRIKRKMFLFKHPNIKFFEVIDAKQKRTAF